MTATTTADTTQARPAFRAVIVPHRSLGRKGFAILMGALVAINAAVGLTFYLMGAWPVLAFCGLDVLAIWLAFKLNYRAGGAHEIIEITDEALTLTRTDPAGERAQTTFNTYWVRVEQAELKRGRVVVWLQSHGRRIAFGAALNDEERRGIARALDAELVRRRSAHGEA